MHFICIAYESKAEMQPANFWELSLCINGPNAQKCHGTCEATLDVRGMASWAQCSRIEVWLIVISSASWCTLNMEDSVDDGARRIQTVHLSSLYISCFVICAESGFHFLHLLLWGNSKNAFEIYSTNLNWCTASSWCPFKRWLSLSRVSISKTASVYFECYFSGTSSQVSRTCKYPVWMVFCSMYITIAGRSCFSFFYHYSAFCDFRFGHIHIFHESFFIHTVTWP